MLTHRTLVVVPMLNKLSILASPDKWPLPSIACRPIKMILLLRAAEASAWSLSELL